VRAIQKKRLITIKIAIEVEKENATTTIEVDVKIQTYDMTKGELIDAIASGAKLTKADAGRVFDTPKKDLFKFKPTLKSNGECGCPKVEVEYVTKEMLL
jgi:hypothetical protein